MGAATGHAGMMEFLSMGGYAGYVWSSYGIAMLVLFLNLLISRRRHKSVLRRLRRLHRADSQAREHES